MRLRGKIIAICIAVVVSVMSGGFLIILRIQEKSLRDADEENAEKLLAIYCSNVASASSTAGVDMQNTTLQSVAAYYFSTYSRLIGTEDIYYSFVFDGKYLYDMSPYDPYTVFKEGAPPAQGEADVIIKRVRAGKDTVLVGYCPFRLSDQVFEGYISMNVSETENKIHGLRISCVIVLLFGCIITVMITVLLVRHVLSPIEKLTQNAISISKGDYHLRTNHESNDEIGILSAAFDKMSESIEEKITHLDMELQKRQLLLGALSHEMKTPMTAIIGYADSLMRMPLSDAQREDCAKKIYDAGKHTERLAQKMMELVGLSEPGQIEKTNFDASEFVIELKAFVPPQVEIACEVQSIYGDKALLLSMLLNLVENGLRASDDNPQVRVLITESENLVRFIVSDRGCGIAPEQIPLIMEPFYRVDKARSRKRGGAGLGLAICRKICEQHGGTLSISSEPGQGTTVTASAMVQTMPLIITT